MKSIFSRLTIVAGVILATLSTIAWAQDVQLRDDHPGEYVVVKGDTLWDISGRFLRNPWEWPAIWQANPQIDNPHLIYPGDSISLIYVDGQPRLVVNQENRLGPRIRETDITPVDTIALDDIDEFLRYPRVVGAEEFQRLPYIVGNQEQRLNSSARDYTYARGITAGVGQEVVIARLNFTYYRRTDRKGNIEMRQAAPSRWGEAHPHSHEPFGWVRQQVSKASKRPVEVIGYELWEIATARIVKAGDPAILQVLGGRREVNAGDYVLPLSTYVYDSHFLPRGMDQVPPGLAVLNISEGVVGVGHNGIVAINGGNMQGINPGHTFSVFRPGATIKDKLKYPSRSIKRARAGNDRNVKLPDEYIGQVMVFRSFDELSYAIVLEGKRVVSEYDILRHPSERL